LLEEQSGNYFKQRMPYASRTRFLSRAASFYAKRAALLLTRPKSMRTGKSLFVLRALPMSPLVELLARTE
jgi:hypothetical protein